MALDAAAEARFVLDHELAAVLDSLAVQRERGFGAGGVEVHFRQRVFLVQRHVVGPGASEPVGGVVAEAGTSVALGDFDIEVLEAGGIGVADVDRVGDDRDQVLGSHDAAHTAPAAEPRLGVTAFELVFGRECHGGVADRRVVLTGGADHGEVRVLAIALCQRLDLGVDLESDEVAGVLEPEGHRGIGFVGFAADVEQHG